jgi:hypothetical protein
VGETRITTLPSRVHFPEVAFIIEGPDATVLLGGDSLLHAATEKLFRSPDPPGIDLACIPCHSISPPGVLLRRSPIDDPERYLRRATANFDKYVATVNAAVTVPSSFGWKVCGDEHGQSYDWLNPLLFPVTPWQAYRRLQEQGRQTLIWGPGDTIDIEHGSISAVHGDYITAPERLADVFGQVTFDPTAQVLPFDPAVDSYGTQTSKARALVDGLADALTGTDYWSRSLEDGLRQLVRVSGQDGDETYCLDFARAQPVERVGDDSAADAQTWIGAATLQSLLDSTLLFGSSYGLWVCQDSLLSAAFHHPRFYARHVNQWLAERGHTGAAA